MQNITKADTNVISFFLIKKMTQKRMSLMTYTLIEKLIFCYDFAMLFEIAKISLAMHFVKAYLDKEGE